MSAILLNQLYAIRAQSEAAILQLEHEMGVGPETPAPPAEEPVGCQHPEGSRRDTSVLGQPHTFTCLDCDEEFEGIA